jgi:hypothetical protein
LEVNLFLTGPAFRIHAAREPWYRQSALDESSFAGASGGFLL